jgi:hypothetical protein
VLLTDRPRQQLPRGFKQQVVVKSSGPLRRSRGEVALPFGLHPDALRGTPDEELHRLREVPRRWRLFFSGACSARYYDTHWIRREFGKMPRSEALEVIQDELPENRTVTPNSWSELEALLDEHVPGFVWVPGATSVIPTTSWLEVLARAEVFLAAPGVSYPMCHNVVEAMSVGVVPLIEYPEQFDPPLRHGQECLVFAGEEQLRHRVGEIMRMPPSELAALGRTAAEYYDRHLSPEGFVGQLEADPRTTLVLHVKGHERPVADR